MIVCVQKTCSDWLKGMSSRLFFIHINVFKEEKKRTKVKKTLTSQTGRKAENKEQNINLNLTMLRVLHRQYLQRRCRRHLHRRFAVVMNMIYPNPTNQEDFC